MDDAIAKLQEIERQLNRVIRGKAEIIHYLLVAVVAGGNVLLDDIPGVGKTTLAKALAKLLGAKFTRIQFTPDLLPADIVGTSIYSPKEGKFLFRPGPVFTHVLLADEINRASPRTQSALLECMCEHQVSTDGETRILNPPFFVIATQNPIEYQGTYPLPEAQLDRFDLRLSLGYPDEAAEAAMLADRQAADPLEKLSPLMECGELLQIQSRLSGIHLEESVAAYLLKLIRSTREEPQLQLGASPRAALRLAECARASALLAGRDFVLPDEVRDLAKMMLPHRLIVESQAKYAGKTVDSILDELIQRTAIPR